VVEEQAGVEQEVPAQEVQEEEELQECPDHHPSSFERGKPRSISPYGLQIFNITYFMFDALSYRSCLQPLLHIYSLTPWYIISFFTLLSLGPS
jgi:hypothetical protein